MRFEYSIKSDIGLIRSENQDAFGKFPEGNPDPHWPGGQLFVVADGLGGHSGGSEASRIAVETVGRVYYADDSGERSGDRLRRAFAEANRAIYKAAGSDPHLIGMGTTCTALVLTESEAFAAHVGDSKLYRIDRHEIRQLTTDHSRVGEMLRAGVIDGEEAAVHPERSILTRAVGIQQTVHCEVLDHIPLGAHVYFLLCTDGLAGYLSPRELQESVLSLPLEDASNTLVQRALDRGGHDNITVIIVRVSGSVTLWTTLSAKIAEGRAALRRSLFSQKN